MRILQIVLDNGMEITSLSPQTSKAVLAALLSPKVETKVEAKPTKRGYRAKRWSTQEDDTLRLNYRDIKVPQIAKSLNRTTNAVRMRISHLGLRRAKMGF